MIRSTERAIKDRSLTATRHMLRLFLMIIFATMAFPVQQAVANRYDDEEVVRRYLERGDQKEQAEREAAKQRYDQNHPSEINSSGGGDAGFVILVIVAVFLLGIGRACGWGGFSWKDSSKAPRPAHNSADKNSQEKKRLQPKISLRRLGWEISAMFPIFSSKGKICPTDTVSLTPLIEKMRAERDESAHKMLLSMPKSLNKKIALKRMRAQQKRKENKERS